MTAASLKDSQLAMARFLRNPKNVAPPAGVEERRLKVYQDLIYNNVEGFISGGFPVLRSLYDDDAWHELVRSFIDGHRCQSPYFLEISQEFIGFLLQEHQPRPCDPPFMAELAHYEWVELALDIAEEELPPDSGTFSVLDSPLTLSPLAWVLSYQYPVHMIGPSFQPAEAAEPLFLVVYRNREDKVQFMALNGPTARLLELVRDGERATGAESLRQLAAEMGMEEESVVAFGSVQLEEMAGLDIVLPAAR